MVPAMQTVHSVSHSIISGDPLRLVADAEQLSACVLYTCTTVCEYDREHNRGSERRRFVTGDMQEALSVGVTSRPHVCAGSVRANTAALQRCWRREPSRRAAAQICKERLLQCSAQAQSSDYITANVEVEPEAETEGMSAWLDGLKWDAGGLVAVMAQVSLKTPCTQVLLQLDDGQSHNAIETNPGRLSLAVACGHWRGAHASLC